MAGKNELVVKSNRLIEAGYRLSLVEQRLILLAIVEARRTGQGLGAEDFLTVAATAYASMFDVPLNKAYEQIKEAALTLYERGFVLYDTDLKSGKLMVIKARWVSAIAYIDGAGAIRLRFSAEVVPYITRLEAEFTRYKLEKIASMSSAYAIRLYELLMQWGSLGRREVELEWLKKTLMVDKNYARLDNFKKWIIDVALAQINEHSDLTATYAQRKTGRNVTHLIFTFGPKEEPARPPKADGAPGDVRDTALFQRLRGHGIGPRVAASWIKQDEARALAAAEYVEARARAGLVKGSAAGYLRTVYESGADIGPSAFEAGLAAQARAEAEAKAGAQGRARAEREAGGRARAAALALAPEARRALAGEYLRSEGGGVAAAWDEKKGGFRDPMLNIPFNLWLEKRVAG